MRDERQKIEATGARLVLVGNGPVHFLRTFIEDLKIDFPAFTDPSKKTYDAAEFEHGVTTVFNPGSGANLIRSMKAGFSLKLTAQGDALQQGGVLVISPDDQVHYHYVSARAGDHPSIDQIVEAASAADQAG